MCDDRGTKIAWDEREFDGSGMPAVAIIVIFKNF